MKCFQYAFTPAQKVSDEVWENVKDTCVIGIAGWARMVTDVTTPHVDGPPPRKAQKRSVFSVLDAVMKWPSAVTMFMERTWSAARP